MCSVSMWWWIGRASTLKSHTWDEEAKYILEFETLKIIAEFIVIWKVHHLYRLRCTTSWCTETWLGWLTCSPENRAKWDEEEEIKMEKKSPTKTFQCWKLMLECFAFICCQRWFFISFHSSPSLVLVCWLELKTRPMLMMVTMCVA